MGLIDKVRKRELDQLIAKMPRRIRDEFDQLHRVIEALTPKPMVPMNTEVPVMAFPPQPSTYLPAGSVVRFHTGENEGDYVEVQVQRDGTVQARVGALGCQLIVLPRACNTVELAVEGR